MGRFTFRLPDIGEGIAEAEIVAWHVAVGDRVVLAFVPACGKCGPCRAGRAALCEPGAAANAAGTLLGGRWTHRAGL